MRSLLIALTALAVGRVPSAAQEGPRASVVRRYDGASGTWARGAVHYAKWATGGVAAWLTVLAAREHDRSEGYWDRLLDLCRADSGQCTLGADGRYASAAVEELYQRSVQHDRRARTRLIAGQAALLVTVVLFLLDRKPGTEGPDNIPFAPLEVSPDPATGGGRLGLSLRF